MSHPLESANSNQSLVLSSSISFRTHPHSQSDPVFSSLHSYSSLMFSLDSLDVFTPFADLSYSAQGWKTSTYHTVVSLMAAQMIFAPSGMGCCTVWGTWRWHEAVMTLVIYSHDACFGLINLKGYFLFLILRSDMNRSVLLLYSKTSFSCYRWQLCAIHASSFKDQDVCSCGCFYGSKMYVISNIVWYWLIFDWFLQAFCEACHDRNRQRCNCNSDIVSALLHSSAHRIFF